MCGNDLRHERNIDQTVQEGRSIDELGLGLEEWQEHSHRLRNIHHTR